MHHLEHHGVCEGERERERENTHTHTLTHTVAHTQAEKAVAKVSGTVTTQLIAHDQEVYDIAFKTGDPSKFASVGAGQS